MTIVVRGTFVLSPGEPLRVPDGPFPLCQGNLSADVFREDDEARSGELLHASDFADYKPRAEVLLRGTCHAPRGRPVTECPVRFSVGAFSKTLRVLGDRAFTLGPTGEVPGEPAGFTKMPVDYRRAFGGPGFADNPVGKGFGTKEVWNVEPWGKRAASPGDRPEPAGFGPINPAWPLRAQKIGKEYGPSYSEKRAPYYAEDFDFAHFNSAPLDQQIDELRGDEEITFVHLHPDAATFSKKLPALRIRAFVDDVQGRFREVRLVLDTLFADLDAERLYLTWRGLEPVQEDDLADVRALLVAPEPLGEPRRPEAEYRRMVEELERDPVGLETAVPEHLRGLWNAARAQSETPSRSKKKKGIDPVSAAVQQKLGTSEPAAQARVQAAIGQLLTSPQLADQRLKRLLSQAVANLPQSGAAPPAPRLDAPRADIGAPLKAAVDKIGPLGQRAIDKGAPASEIARVEALTRDPRLRALDPSLADDAGAGPPPAPAPGVDLQGRDLRGKDLRGADLRGANLENALLSGANLRGAVLDGACLRGAVLFEADLSAASLVRADLTRATLSSARAEEAIFREAVLDEVQARKAVLDRADLSSARAAKAFFEEASFRGAVLRQAVIEDAVLDAAVLDEADLTRATLARCRLLGALARKASFEKATMPRISFSGADLADARFLEAEAPRSIWLRAQLARADLRYASLPEAHFSEARCESASFRGATLSGARFYRASLPSAVLVQANLMGADLCKADLTRSRLADANLYDAKLLGAVLAGCDLTGARLTRSTLERT